MTDLAPITVDELKDEVRRKLADIREQIGLGDFNLKPEVQSALVTDSAFELDEANDLDALLKSKGVPRRARKAFIKQQKKGPKKVPAHTARANAIALKRAKEREVAKLAQ